MNTKILFTERQRFKQTWLWALLIIIDGIFIYGLISQIFLKQPFGDHPMSNEMMVIVTLIILLVTVLFLLLRLDTAIDTEGVSYRYFPLQIRYKKITWERISTSYVRQYNPITEYGGWGIRIGLFGKGQAFNVSGNKGLQLGYDNGKRFLIGTQQPQEMEKVLHELGQNTHQDKPL